MLIGSSVAPFLRAATLTSSDASVTITNGPGTIDLRSAATGSITAVKGITKSAGSSTTAPGGSNVAVATGWTLCKMTINAAATSVSFYVNGTLIGTSTTNISTSATQSLGVMIIKTAGTTARTLDLDYCSWFHQLTTSRF